jgi:hypothetical protein
LSKGTWITIQHKALSRVSLNERLEDFFYQIVGYQLAFFDEGGCPFSELRASLDLSSQSFSKGKMLQPEVGPEQFGLGSFATTGWSKN